MENNLSRHAHVHSSATSIDKQFHSIPPHYLLKRGLDYAGWKTGTTTHFRPCARNWCSRIEADEAAANLNQGATGGPVWQVVPLEFANQEVAA